MKVILFFESILSFSIKITHLINPNNRLFKNVAVCREWLVHEDGALAYRLQDEESKIRSFIKYY